MVARINQDHMIELGGQFGPVAQKVDRLSDSPVGGGGHHLALHQAAGGIFGIGQRLGDGGTVTVVKRAEDKLFLRFFQILDDIDHIVGIQFADRFGQNLVRQRLDHLFADRIIQFRQDVAVDSA